MYMMHQADSYVYQKIICKYKNKSSYKSISPIFDYCSTTLISVRMISYLIATNTRITIPPIDTIAASVIQPIHRIQ